MPKVSKQQTTLLIVVLAVVAVSAVKFFQTSSSGTLSSTEARAKGNPKASVQVIEFVDFQCPACAGGASILKDYLVQFPQGLHVDMKYFPLSGHAHGFRSSLYAECSARQGKFWEFQDLVFQRQAQWSGLTNADPAFQKIAQEVGLDLTKLQACLSDEKTPEVIFKDKEEGQNLGVKSTPTYFVNGKMVVGTKLLKDEINAVLFPKQ